MTLQKLRKIIYRLRSQVVTAASLVLTVMWDAAPCSLVGVYRCLFIIRNITHCCRDGGSKHL
jgi:hypothetical protein